MSMGLFLMHDKVHVYSAISRKNELIFKLHVF